MIKGHFLKYQIQYQYLLLAFVCYSIFLLKLGSFHMRFWDESMFAVNTYEMMKNGQYFALFFDGQPDLFNTKPPLTSWLQLLSVKALGYNEMAIRLPSALASIISVFALFQFLFKNFSAQLAWIAVLILVTAQGYVGFHTSRTGDSDALLSCFLLLGNLQILNYLLRQKKQSILYFFMFLILAVLAKLFAGILFLPSILVILLWQKKLKAVVLTWQFLFGLIGFLAITTSVLLLREAANPGYLAIAFGKDAGRVFDVIEGHQESALYYVDLLFNAQFSIYMLFTIIGLFATAWLKGPLKTLVGSATILVIGYLFIISFSITKLHWYTMPLFPLLAIIAAVPLHELLNSLKWQETYLSKTKKIILIICFFTYPFIIMFSKSQGNSIAPGDRLIESKELYLFNAIKRKENLHDMKIYHHNWKGSLLFYKYKLAENQQILHIETTVDKFQENDKVLVSNDSLKNVLKTFYPGSIQIEKYENAVVYELKR